MSENGKILYFEAPTIPSPADESDVASICPLDALEELSRSMEDCGQDPVTQLAGYLITEDPVYLPECNCARNLARHVSRDEILRALLENFLASRKEEPTR